MEWQPIETAPKDIGVLIGFAGLELVGEAYFRSGDSEADRDRGWWWANEGPGDYHAELIVMRLQEPTHWMPLPSPPSQENQGG